jgi:hypothetical protein
MRPSGPDEPPFASGPWGRKTDSPLRGLTLIFPGFEIFALVGGGRSVNTGRCGRESLDGLPEMSSSDRRAVPRFGLRGGVGEVPRK